MKACVTCWQRQIPLWWTQGHDIGLSQRVVKGTMSHGYSCSSGDAGCGFHSGLNQRHCNPISLFPPLHQHYGQFDPTVSRFRSLIQQRTEPKKPIFSISLVNRTAHYKCKWAPVLAEGRGQTELGSKQGGEQVYLVNITATSDITERHPYSWSCNPSPCTCMLCFSTCNY